MSDETELASLATKHPYLYHYTSEAGFRGIFESNALWGTYFADLNDSQEIHAVRTPLVEELTDAFISLVKEFRQYGFKENQIVSKAGGNQAAARNIARSWVNSLYTVTFQEPEQERVGLCCITSFCSHADDQEYERENGLLSQWRGYGGQGGYCLVFDTTKLIRLIRKESKKFFYLHVDLSPAFYFISTLPLHGHFSDLFSFSRDIVRTAMSGNKNFTVERIFKPFVTAATTTKHRGFQEEREVRLVAMAATAVADAKIKNHPDYKPEPLKGTFTTEREGRKRTHIALFGKNSDPLPVTKIIVGPSSVQSDNVKRATEVTGGKIMVVSSETPYIG